MARPNQEIRTYFGQCKCCLNYAYLRNMWDQHCINGEREIYVKMLEDCFSISWPVNEHKEDDKICEVCVLSLRNANSFKMKVLESQEKLKELKTETGQVSKEIIEVKIEEYDADDQKDYMDIQYLDEVLIEQDCDGDDVEDGDSQGNDSQGNDSQDYKPEKKKRKWSKKSRTEQSRPYRQYTKDTLENAVESVKSSQMTMKQASEAYNVPARMISRVIRGMASEPRKELVEYIKEVRAILTFTNATPFKSKANNFFCLFCPAGSAPMRDPVELRTHIHQAHDKIHIRIEFAMRPFNAFEMIRLDVEDLTCHCNEKLPWLEMLEHLESKHDVVIEETKKRVVPYILNTKEIQCVLCDYKSCYTLMDAHMNLHYQNYICGECGDPFLTMARFQKHGQTHQIGIYPCEYCNKMFAREIYRRKHTDFVHKRKSVFKCWHCNERFPTDAIRRRHTEEQHNETFETYKTCEVCNKTYSANYYVKHYKRCSGNLEYQCDVCNKKFDAEKVLNEHKLRHSGIKSFQCDVCFKPYFSPAAVRMHKKYKHGFSKSKTRETIERVQVEAVPNMTVNNGEQTES